jgi:hypothetical protein
MSVHNNEPGIQFRTLMTDATGTVPAWDLLVLMNYSVCPRLAATQAQVHQFGPRLSQQSHLSQLHATIVCVINVHVDRQNANL